MVKDPQESHEHQEKIIEIIISQRILLDNKYVLSQDRLARILFTIWGSASALEGMHYNDKLRLFGLIMTREDNRFEFQRLAEGVTSRAGLDDPLLSPASIFQKLWFQFNNEDYIVQLPDNAYDFEGSDALNPHNFTRININRDWKCIQNVYNTIVTGYKA